MPGNSSALVANRNAPRDNTLALSGGGRQQRVRDMNMGELAAAVEQVTSLRPPEKASSRQDRMIGVSLRRVRR